MKNNFDTVREALTATRALLAKAPVSWKWASTRCELALRALDQIEADHAHDLATAAASGFRDGVASVQGEPVAWQGVHDPTDLYFTKPPQADVHPLYRASPIAQQQEPDLTSLFFAVERAVENGHCPWEIEAAFDEYEAARKAAPVAQPQAEAVPTVQIVNCDTCKHSANSCDDYPCNRCGVEFGDGPFDRWEAPQQAEAVPDVTDAMALAFHRALTDGAIGQSEVEEIKIGLRAALESQQAEAVWVNPELEHMAEEAECVSMCLNDRGVPSKDGSKPLSLWGRVQQYANPRFLEGMTTNTPIISSEHIKALAQVCRLIGNYTTAEFVQNVVGFAQVLLANKAVQEAFVKANAHLLYAAPQQAEAVPHCEAGPDHCPQCEAEAVPELTGCDCRWRGDEVVSRCELHEAWHVAIHEWAERAKTAEAKQAEAVPPGYALVPLDVLQAASESLGSFVSDNGWTDLDMQAMDNIDAILAQQKGGV